jgi:hypothetical protein
VNADHLSAAAHASAETLRQIGQEMLTSDLQPERADTAARLLSEAGEAVAKLERFLRDGTDPESMTAGFSASTTSDSDALTQARRKNHLLSMSDSGRAALESRPDGAEYLRRKRHAR